MITLSILVPHFEDLEGLALSLASVRAQTWKGRQEIVICDDGSSSANLRRLRQLLDQPGNEDVRLLCNTTNRGRPYTRNVLLDAAEGKYTAWLDSGDEWYPPKTERQLEVLFQHHWSAPGAPAWCTCHYDWQWQGGRKKLRVQAVRGDPVDNLLRCTLASYLWTTLARTEHYRQVGYFDLDLPRLQDLDFFLRFASKGGIFLLPDTKSALCVYHKSDVGRDASEILRCYRRVFETNRSQLLRFSRRYRRNRTLHMYLHAARFAKNNRDYGSLIGWLGMAGLVHPAGFVRRMIKSSGKL